MEAIRLIFTLIVAFQIKQFLCDYPLQTNYMLGKFSRGLAWIAPLFLHAFVHASATAIIICFVNPKMIWLALVDLALHFAIDRLKVVYGNSDMTNKYFWWALGADQMAHSLTHYAIIFILIK